MCGRLMSPAHETQSMREIRLLRARLPRKGGGLTGMYTKWEKCIKKDRMHTLTCITQTLFFTFNYLELNK